MKEKLNLEAEVAGKTWLHYFAGQSLHMHRHDELEINLITRGRGTYLLGDRKYELHRHDLVWLFPEQDHVLLNQSSDYRMWIMVFKPKLVEQASMYSTNHSLRGRNPSGDFCRRLSESQSARLANLFEEVTAASTDLDRYNSGLAYALTLAWSAHCATDTLSPFSGVHPCVEQAARILRNENEAVDLPQLARHVGLSPSRLSRLFKSQIGVTLSEFRNRQRLDRFCEIYDSGNYNLQEAALKAGFGSYPQFHRVFKGAMGYSPIHYRREGIDSGLSDS